MLYNLLPSFWEKTVAGPKIAFAKNVAHKRNDYNDNNDNYDELDNNIEYYNSSDDDDCIDESSDTGFRKSLFVHTYYVKNWWSCKNSRLSYA